MYLAGQGVKADALDAYAWSVLAAESGLDKSMALSEALLADIADKSKAEREAGKLLDKYGKAALQEKADQMAARENGRRSGSCTGSRLTCRGVAAYSKTHESAGAPPVDPAGG
jgi:TPR repeat protein